MQEVAATRQQPEVVEGVACVHPVGCGAYKPSFPTLIVHSVEIDSKVFLFFFFFFALSAPGLAVRTGRGNVIHIVAAVSIIICTAAVVEGIEESTAAAWLRESTSECKQLIIGKWMFGGRECGSSSLEESSKPVFISDLDALY